VTKSPRGTKDAIFRIVTWETGTFELQSPVKVDVDELHESADDLLMEMAPDRRSTRAPLSLTNGRTRIGAPIGAAGGLWPRLA
jgi:hypothetical protein